MTGSRQILYGLLVGLVAFGLSLLINRLQLPAGVVFVAPLIVFTGFYLGARGALAASFVLLTLYTIILFPTVPYSDTAAAAILTSVILLYGTIAILSGRARTITIVARGRERTQATLRRLADDLAGAVGFEQVAAGLSRGIGERFGRESVVLMFDRDEDPGDESSAADTEQRRSVEVIGPDPIGIDRTTGDRVIAAYDALARGTVLEIDRGTLYPLISSGVLLGAVLIESGRQSVPVNREGTGDREAEILPSMIATASIAINREILAQQAMESDLHQRHEELYAALLSSISHDFRTPLASIAGAAETLAMPQGMLNEGARQELVGLIREEAERLNRFVANLLDMTKLEAGNLVLGLEAVDYADVVGTALMRMRRGTKSHTVEVDLPADLPMIRADFVLFEHVVSNLIENAMKYSDEGTTIRIEGERRGGRALLRIVDEGVGIPPEDLENIFEKFYRVSQADTVSAGTGLGLSICRGIVAAHGGNIRAISPVSVDGGGTMLEVSMPIADIPSDEYAVADETESPVSEASGPTIDKEST